MRLQGTKLLVLGPIRIAAANLCTGREQSLARYMIYLEPRAIGVLEKHRVVPRSKTVLSRWVNYMGADLHQKIVRFVDIGTLTSEKQW
jgi:hypothetical protein